MEKMNFIKFLDDFKSKQEVLNNDYLKFIQTVNAEFYGNNYGAPKFVGYCPPLTDQYALWKQNHEITLSQIEDSRPKIHIDVSINEIGDLLKIVKENPYDEQYQYNIDLKALHNIQEELESLENMVGMKNIKVNIMDQLLYFLQGLHNVGEGDYKHTILYGPPGTGKTEIAKIMGQMYSKIGILKNNCFRKVTRGDLIAGYLGQTAIKTKKVIDECSGGVLFIDEVYSLGSQVDDDNYSKECIDTLCEALSDRKNELMVIVAGYQKEINERFLQRNSGLSSRFIWKFKMDEYDYNDLFVIFQKKVEKSKWTMDKEEITNIWFKENEKEFISCGRDIEKLFSYAKVAHGRRLYGSSDIKKYCITLSDIDRAMITFKENKMKEEENNLQKHILQTLYC